MRCELIKNVSQQISGCSEGENNAVIDSIDFSDKNFMVISFGSTVIFRFVCLLNRAACEFNDSNGITVFDEKNIFFSQNIVSSSENTTRS